MLYRNAYGGHISLGKEKFLISDLLAKKSFNFNCGGKISVLECSKKEEFSFLDYVLNGLDMSLCIAIDFTLSNKPPNDPTSLHYFDLKQNQYLQAITSVGGILENYDSDKLFPFLGFGGRIPYLMDNASHCFAINGNIFSPEVVGIQGVIESILN